MSSQTAQPEVSVIIPTFNRPDFLRRAIRSVLSQQFSDFEIIVVDDASQKSPIDVISEFNDSRIRLFRHELNTGEAATRNTGIRNSAGRFIAFLDDDDEWESEKLQLQMDLMNGASDEVGAVYSAFVWLSWPDRNRLGEKHPLFKGRIYRKLLVRNVIGTPSTVLIRKICLDRVGLFDENVAYGVDHDLWLRIAQHFRIEAIDRPLVRCYVHPDRLSSKLELIIRGQMDIMRKYPVQYPEQRQYHSFRYLAIGEQFCLLGNMKRGREYMVKAIQMNTLNWRAYPDYIFALFGKSIFSKWRHMRRQTARFVRSAFKV